MNMKLSSRTLAKAAILTAAVGAITSAGVSLADPPFVVGCWRNIECLDVWRPVICSDGRVYSNDCYAYRACATGCVPYNAMR